MSAGRDALTPRTFDDDFARLVLEIGPRNIPLVALGLTWPPPERIWLDGNGCREEGESVA